MRLALAVILWLLVAFGVWFIVSLGDEDANHWNWSSDEGPGVWTQARFVAYGAAVATVVVGLPAWFLLARSAERATALETRMTFPNAWVGERHRPRAGDMCWQAVTA